MSDSPHSFQRLTVIGLGLIGGSLAMAARAVYPELWIQGVDSDAEALTYAIQSNVVDKVSRTVPEYFEEDHLIVIATHLKGSLEVLESLAQVINAQSPQNVVVSDVGSCKRQICTLGEKCLPRTFIGAHPMAGKEFSGIDQATSLLFANKAFLICPPPQVDETALNNLEAFIHGLYALPKRIDPETHDRYMAYVSHLPQLYSILLTNMLFHHEPAKLLAYHGGGIDDQLRLAASPFSMWGDVFSQNSDNLKAVLGELVQLIEAAQGQLDTPEMEEWFMRSNYVHRAFHELKKT